MLSPTFFTDDYFYRPLSIKTQLAVSKQAMALFGFIIKTFWRDFVRKFDRPWIPHFEAKNEQGVKTRRDWNCGVSEEIPYTAARVPAPGQPNCATTPTKNITKGLKMLRSQNLRVVNLVTDNVFTVHDWSKYNH